ncbi:hypothetical protein [Persicitalea sp.]|uniref:hypothetical protein n=1 Tax=Persicitalea sp. TaxID=3100273 RepID=UPI003593823C
MRKLSTLVLLAFLAAPALCLAASPGPDEVQSAPESSVIWIALGNTPIAVNAIAPKDHLVMVCYFGVTMMVREKIAKRYLRIGARCGSCEGMKDPTKTLLPVGGYLNGGSVCETPCSDLLAPGVGPCDSTPNVIEAPASAVEVVKIGK